MMLRIFGIICVCVVLAVFAGDIRFVLLNSILPGEPEMIEVLVGEMFDQIKDGEQVLDAIASFCGEIFECADVSG